MIPDLGKYTFEVSMSYGIGLALLAGLVAVYVIRARQVRKQLIAAEARKDA